MMLSSSGSLFLNISIKNKLLYIYIYINTNFIDHNRYFLSPYFLLDPFVSPYCFYRIRRELIYVFSIIVYIPSTFCPTLGHHQILEALYIRNMQPTFNRINFQTSANVLKCL